jgi:23S rRNA (cytosine1962-C5)-methyltransferase
MQATTILPTEGYELLDSGNGLRLERFGQHTVVRPDPSVLWDPASPKHPAWINPDAQFTDTENEKWRLRKPQLQDGWEVNLLDFRMLIKPTPFRHVGLFPEQAANWEWLQKVCRGGKAKVLNLFGYTGAASIAAAKAGALVTHVDSSKGTVYWASENAKRSKVENIRWIVDDVQKFVAREVRRGAKYDVIILDPPVFGRGAKGEIWRLEEDLPELLMTLNQLLSEKPAGFLLNFYATTLYPESMLRLTEQALKGMIPVELQSLCLQETESGKLLQSGYSVRSK